MLTEPLRAQRDQVRRASAPGPGPACPTGFPPAYGLTGQLLQVAPPAAASAAPATLQIWNKLALGYSEISP